MAASISSSCFVSSLRLLPFKPSLQSRPITLSFHRTIITFQKTPTRTIIPPISALPSPSHSSNEPLPPKLDAIVKLFQSVQEPRAKYEQLLFYGKNLKPLEPQYKTSDNKVQGCVSQVWVRAFFDKERNVVYEADSDSVLTKGLAALLVQGLSGSSVVEVLRVKPDFVLLLGLQQSLSASRNNGFVNMLKLMQKKAIQLEIKGEEEEQEDTSVLEAGPDSKPSVVEEFDSGLKVVALGTRGMRIREVLEKELSPVELEVEDVSKEHVGHAGVGGGETHFNLRVVSDVFGGKSLIKRHRMVHDLLKEELESGLHALSIVAKTPGEV